MPRINNSNKKYIKKTIDMKSKEEEENKKEISKKKTLRLSQFYVCLSVTNDKYVCAETVGSEERCRKYKEENSRKCNPRFIA